MSFITDKFFERPRAAASGIRRPFRARRKGQTAIEYLLVTVSLLFVFVMMYRSLQWYLSNQFTRGGIIILQMYKEDPW